MKNKMTIYYIYEIPGVKVGCTKNLKKRVEQRQKCPLGKYKVLGAANNIKDASELEKEWQIKLGYKVDKLNYIKVQNLVKKQNTPEAIAKAIANTDYKARTKNFDYDKKTKNTDYQSFQAKRVEKISKAIIQSDLDDNILNEYKNSVEASLKTGISKQQIRKCCRGEIKTSGGYKWKNKK